MGVASGSGAAVTADPVPPYGGDAVCAFARIDAMASEDAPYFTNRRLDNFRGAANGLPSATGHEYNFARRALVYERDQAPDPLTIPRIFSRKLLAHELLFGGRLQQETDEREPQADECTDLSHRDRSTGEREQESRINRMPHQRVRPAQNQFVI